MYEKTTWAEINLSAIAHNIQELRRIAAPGAQLMAVVKADAYGHGAVETARIALDNGVVILAVSRVSEGVALREAGIDCPVLVLGYLSPGEVLFSLKNDLSHTVFNMQQAEILSDIATKAGIKAKVHIKIETGMGRLGFEACQAVVEQVIAVTRLSHLKVDGIFTHFAVSDIIDKSYTRQQLFRFQEVLRELHRKGVDIQLKHAANSAAIIDMPDTHLNMVRAGIAMYGLYPSEGVDKSRIVLQPAMSFKTQVGHIKRVPAGYPVSYGCTYITRRPTLIATLPVGYADGYSRLLSSRAEVLIHGQRAPVVGRVCMDQCMIDVGHINDPLIGDEVVLWGQQGESSLPVEEVAEKMGTINYELVCMVNVRVPRVYI
ncbi:alanine racemase [Desulfofarcimen acetoxidans DSM 771]|jgi:alanine racemase|uniref:Alanine racemase n=1 Tax=Desulfofarcimen acetoxidans (strain ATCC 49208 / DSM 771 / KCTC 5769 / VKM B-1644 / 5575) TaxID=485916 RepID=C8VX81_DESAS|nr:alanine racemase [Desulfofarcimen acetoxidans]ACV64477.1 alanine racemase [Desulfofarcimen acetoxidans DSM 771]